MPNRSCEGLAFDDWSANDDVVYQDGGDSYVRGYSKGAQKAWLERELAAAHQDHDVDWIVVCMHQAAISTADKFNGADLGIRQEWVPLFDQYGVDLVVCGHEHHYERSHPIRGQQSNLTLTPIPAGTATDVIDTTKGTVHMVLACCWVGFADGGDHATLRRVEKQLVRWQGRSAAADPYQSPRVTSV